MTVEFTAKYGLIGGLKLSYGEPDNKDFITMRVPREALSDLAIAAIQEIGADASEELMELCGQVVTMAGVKDVMAGKVPPWRTLDEETQNEIVEMVMEDIRDDLKGRAHDELNNRDLRSLADDMLMGEMEDDPTQEQIDEWIKEHVVS